ncbi:NAD(P)-dependent oxidoreductase, partial [Sandarakinorhabdus oryzae]|uniref:NAD(P)-dependent oxidoreductase n=1 Tax=Sandarakinorhabdus oryzae TaxID=2675220 RepID=UPI0012E1DCDC
FSILSFSFSFPVFTGCASLGEALAGAAQVISVVIADAAVAAAEAAAPHLSAGSFYFDMNSVSPGAKQAAARAITAAGGHYVDTAVMAPVNPQRLAVPLLLAGPEADAGQVRLAALGFSNIHIVGSDIGRAATIKMLRSVLFKGMEALTAECLLACDRAGVTDEVVASFGAGFAEQADYRFDRMLVHGTRRAAEMVEAAKTLTELGIEPLLTRGTIARQADLGGRGHAPPPAGLAAKLEALR